MRTRAFHLTLLALLAALLLPAASQAQPDQRCFPETGQCISGRIRQYWEQNGGLAVFGLPLTEARREFNRETEASFQTQWFERTRLELHPENRAPYDVLLGRLGDDRLRQDGRDWQGFPRGEPQPGCRYFPETQQNVCGAVLRMWRASGLEFDGRPGTSEAESLALFGLPVSPLITESVEGRSYQVQWFERVRFELHPENRTPYDVLLGRLGAETRDAARFSSAGEIVYTNAGGLYRISASGLGGPTRVKLPTTEFGGISPHLPVWSPDGRWIALSYENRLLLVDAVSGLLSRVLDSNGVRPSWSPDGQRIAYTTYTPAQPNPLGQIAVINIDGSGRTLLTSQGSNIKPRWSPDGSKIAFQTRRLPDASDYYDDSGHQLALINPDGSGFTTLTELNQGYAAVWSPDGQRLAFTSLINDRTQIVALNIGDRTYETLTAEPDGVSNPSWSPDGRRLVYQLFKPGQPNVPVIVTDARGQGRRQIGLASLDTPPRWSPDSSRLVLTVDSRIEQHIAVISADGLPADGLPAAGRIALGSEPSWRP